MTEPIDIICEVEDAIADLQALSDADCPDPRILSEIRRLDNRLRHYEATLPIFVQPA